MNRSLFNVLFAGFGTGGGAIAAGEEGEEQLREINAEDAAVLMAYGKRVIIVPGYGMAVAQAQGPVRELMDLLIARGVDVQFAIHPVAGRMPGHMNVLLAEANVPYDRLKEMDEINDDFADTDVALIIGANDVVNPVGSRGGLADQRHADPQRRPGAERHRPEARPRRRLRRHPEPALQQREDEDAVRRREAVRRGPRGRGEAGVARASVLRWVSPNTNARGRPMAMSHTLIDSINEQLSDERVQRISNRIGSDPTQTRAAIDEAVPLLLGALGAEAQDPQAAPGLQRALAEDHNGALLDELDDYLDGNVSGRQADGTGILDMCSAIAGPWRRRRSRRRAAWTWAPSARCS